ncbi:hypothetical protein JAAARDRAFT_200949 [Jaapia argillacea MUCL 33604]|uniref:Uncharacterized protein n=1 Tax=Jaapia argillacea MUCL 33604 TaxID=933084 RepID=A0A067P309_9AGAM|nr:hypothetical protein JAAARDRAFT_200949 [Jaapia argillacea MUCL 33604]
MSLTQLEYLAIAPHRFISLIRKSLNNGHKKMIPISTRLLNLDSPSGLPPPRLTTLRLLPGGRFLLTGSQHSYTVDIWDLGCTPSALIPAFAIASVAVSSFLPEDERRSQFLVQPLEDGSGFYVLVVSAEWSWEREEMDLQFTVLAVEPLSLPPRFEIIAQLTTTNGEFPRIFLTTRVVGWAGYTSVNLWDFHRDSHSRFALDRTTTQIVCTSDCVWFVGYGVQQAVIYPARQLDAAAGGTIPIESSLQTYDLGEMPQGPVYILPPGGFDSSYLDLLTLRPPTTIYHYLLPPPTSLPNVGESKPALLRKFTFGDPGLTNYSTDVRVSSTSWDGEKALVVWYKQTKGIYAALPKLKENETEAELESVQLWRDPEHYQRKTLFDWSPLLGRLVLMTPEYEIRVMDFVPPLS